MNRTKRSIVSSKTSQSNRWDICRSEEMDRNIKFYSLKSMCFRKSIVEAVIMNTLVQILCTFENLLGIKIWALSETYKISTLLKNQFLFLYCMCERVHVCITLFTLPRIRFCLSTPVLSGKFLLRLHRLFSTSLPLELLSHLPHVHLVSWGIFLSILFITTLPLSTLNSNDLCLFLTHTS